ncbi:NAD(P)-binding domain-containing protein [Nisaea sp.]|uniref:NAD(P)-binding domain-containing protein n=1 Tax=Nisaea sp. TaxID=2024842 RepID=UPI003B51A651
MNMLNASTEALPVAVIGAGPVGLAAAAQLTERGLPFLLLEAGDKVGAAIREWGHVRLFSPWIYNTDRTARRMLEETGWTAPADSELPTGHELVEHYLEPLSRLDAIRPHLRFGARVISVGRKDFDKARTAGRAQQPFELRLADGSSIEARAVIDASGTWRTPNPVGSGGVKAPGEETFSARISYGIPDVLDEARATFTGRRVLVVGSGHSAMNVILDLLDLQREAPGTQVIWALRRTSLDAVFGGGEADALPARGTLGTRVREAVEAGRLQLLMPFRIRSIGEQDGALLVNGQSAADTQSVPVDRIVGTTGFRPDLDMLREIRLDLDPWLEAPRALAPMIDPNLHSCGTVRPHGAQELAHPEQDFFVAGMKSYGRAPTFLMATGYEQVRSIVAALAGDHAAAARVELDLPETGVCSAPTEMETASSCCGSATQTEPVESAAQTCCGGPPPSGVDACCLQDAAAKAAGEAGCGCSNS